MKGGVIAGLNTGAMCLFRRGGASCPGGGGTKKVVGVFGNAGVRGDCVGLIRGGEGGGLGLGGGGGLVLGGGVSTVCE